MSMKIHSSIKARILKAQSEASNGANTLVEMLKGLDKQFERKEDGGLYLAERIWVPVYGNLRSLIMNEAHTTKYSVHPGVDKMYYDLRDLYWWPGMKKNITLYILEITAESIRNATGSEYRLPSPNRWLNERTIQTLEDMLRACAMDFGNVKETTDKIVQIKERLKAARDRQKSYADKRRKPLEFSVGDKVQLKVSPWKGMVRFGIHDTFHVSNLKKCLADVNLHVPLEEIKIDYKLRFVEEPIKIMDREVKKLKRSWIPIVKVCWNSRRGPEFTWEREDEMKRKYPQLFVSATA
ncbi:putative reverse transcriptase domain-containing protein [Tanacetum coccineum]